MITQAEQRGGNPKSFKQMELFSDCLANCGLADLGFSGYPFTWDNKRDGTENIQSRMDRATCDDGFTQTFPETRVEHVLVEDSDYAALVVYVQQTQSRHRGRDSWPFRYKEMWARHEGYDDMVLQALNDASRRDSSAQGVCNRLRLVSRSIQEWGGLCSDRFENK